MSGYGPFRPSFKYGQLITITAAGGPIIVNIPTNGKSVRICNIGTGACFFRVGKNLTVADDPTNSGVYLSPGSPSGYNPAAQMLFERDPTDNEMIIIALADTQIHIIPGEGGKS